MAQYFPPEVSEGLPDLELILHGEFLISPASRSPSDISAATAAAIRAYHGLEKDVDIVIMDLDIGADPIIQSTIGDKCCGHCDDDANAECVGGVATAEPEDG